jgi:P27 family predicted phage terminase small subunit
MAGRRPKPTAVKDLTGNPGHRPLNGTEPQPKPSTARAPRGLGIDGARFWHKYAPALAGLGVLTAVDEPALEMAAEHYEVAIRAAHQLHDEELTVEGRDGPKKNPLTQILRDNSTALRSWLTEFGMTPASRSKLHAPTEEQPSLADELFRMAAERAAVQADDPLREFE